MEYGKRRGHADRLQLSPLKYLLTAPPKSGRGAVFFFTAAVYAILKNMKTSTSHRRAGFVWLLSALILSSYALLGLFGFTLPGVEQLVTLMSKTSGALIFGAAFTAILLEGTYIIGSFIPGTSLLTVLAILSQAGGPLMFLGTVLSIILGWCLAGFINIYVITRLGGKYQPADISQNEVHDNIFVTWYPAFRANHEVAQVASGLPRSAVLKSALRVRLIASSLAAILTLIIPLFVDIRTVSNKEGFLSVLVVAIVCFGIASTHLSGRALILSIKTKEKLRAILGLLIK